MGEGEESRVLSEPSEVAAELVKHLDKWMGKGKKFWFTGNEISADSDEGRAMRRLIAELGDGCDMEQLGVPRKYAKVLRAFKRVTDKQDLYRGVDGDITLLEWVRHWMWASKGTSPGPSGLTHDLIAALTHVGQGDIDTDEAAEEKVSETSKLLLLLVNLTIRTKRIPAQWKRRAIRVVPKAPGDINIANVRPITLLESLCKCVYRVLIQRVYKVWEKSKLLSKWQWAFRSNAGAEQPLALLQLLTEQSYERKQTLLAMSQPYSLSHILYLNPPCNHLSPRQAQNPEETNCRHRNPIQPHLHRAL